VTLAYGVIHAIPVSLGLLPGYLSTWGEALWWAFALVILLTLMGLGVLGRGIIRWLRGRSATEAVPPDRASE
jgi:quinol-cytochrome oxidoreductase complex cytochrome b subunit